MEDGFSLGNWVRIQRDLQRERSIPNVKRRLNDIDFAWDPHDEDWEKGLQLLLEFRSREGHINVPLAHVEKAFKLGHWVNNQRALGRRGDLEPERKQRLDDIDFVWSPQDAKWERGFRSLSSFRDREGHCLVKAKYVDDDGFRLGQWVTVQRTDYRRGKLSDLKKRRLEERGFAWQAPRGGVGPSSKQPKKTCS
jgi:hypothetical protein